MTASDAFVSSDIMAAIVNTIRKHPRMPPGWRPQYGSSVWLDLALGDAAPPESSLWMPDLPTGWQWESSYYRWDVEYPREIEMTWSAGRRRVRIVHERFSDGGVESVQTLIDVFGFPQVNWLNYDVRYASDVRKLVVAETRTMISEAMTAAGGASSGFRL